MLNIFVGNLDITVTEQQLQEVFTAHGAIESVKIVVNRDTGAPRGIAFVEMADATQGKAAITALDGQILNGRPMRVNEARAKLSPEAGREAGSREHRRHRT